MDKCREAFEAWFRTTKAYQMLEEMNYFKVDLFKFIEAPRNEYSHSSVQVAFTTWQSRQAEVDQLQEELAKLKDRLELAHHLATQSTWSSLKQLRKVIKALRDSNQYKEHRANAEEQIKKGARLTNHQIDLGDKNANS